jgi:hypothetical protein
MDVLYKKSLLFGATDFGISKRNNKRFFVKYDGKIIHFGLKHGSTFIDHMDETKRKNWYKRHSKIKNKNGQYVIKLKTSPDFWAYKILWT